jgi:hypothetical protein
VLAPNRRTTGYCAMTKFEKLLDSFTWGIVIAIIVTFSAIEKMFKKKKK